jgi:hypothetical protein
LNVFIKINDQGVFKIEIVITQVIFLLNKKLMDTELRNIFCWGDLDKLTKYDKDKLNEEMIKDKLNEEMIKEIEMWETEDQNQNPVI